MFLHLNKKGGRRRESTLLHIREAGYFIIDIPNTAL
jgi:hypothetical protein